MPSSLLRGAYFVLSASTLFLSAFLLFLVQPLAAKHLLPYFGGSSSVWALSLAFFTTTLFLGYLYVFLLTRYTGRYQGAVHATLVAAIGLSSFFALTYWHSLFPSLEWTVGSAQPPALNVLYVLTLAIGAPYFLLATTGPLLQYWWGTYSQTEPYALYALSNAASFLALVSYPFFIEPHFTLSLTEKTWSVLFLVTAAIIIGLSLCIRHRETAASKSDNASLREKITWIASAALPAYLLVATTTILTQVIAPVPLLWVLPLSIYLVTYILAFRGWGQSVYLPLVVMATSYLAYHFTNAPVEDTLLHMSSYLALLFVGGLMCHAYLYSRRPAITTLPLFYLLAALGGAIGTGVTSIVAPHVFIDFYEFPLGICLIAACAGWIFSKRVLAPRINTNRLRAIRIVYGAILLTLFVQVITADSGVLTIYGRNFYGPTQIRFFDGIISLVHGTTLHGLQSTDPEWRVSPSSYYVPTSGLGRAMIFERDARKSTDIRVGTIGLGTGSIASYCTQGDVFTFYEIDPRIETLARTYFSYLAQCPGESVHIGDGRLLLASEEKSGTLGHYDILALDAFSDDTVPSHLLTTQAIALYARHLRNEKSIIALHISNRFLDLAPALFRSAAELKLSAMIVRDNSAGEPLGVASTWMLLSPGSDTFTHIVFAHASSRIPDISHAPLWTDEYTSILTVLNVEAMIGMLLLHIHL